MTAINSRMILIFFAISLINPLAQSGTDKEYRTVCVPDSVLHNEILGCYLDEFSASDKKLNIIYKQKMEILSTNKKKKLKKEQRNWIKEKDALCVADEANYGRESHFDAMQCQIDIINERINYIRKYK